MTSQQISSWAAVGVLAGVLAVAGCGSGGDDTASATPTGTPRAATSAPAAGVPAALRGSWKRAMTLRDWGSDGYPLGTWRFDVDDDGAVNVYLPRTDSVDFSTEFAVAGRRLTIDAVPLCPGETGGYSWRANGDELMFTAVDDDECAARAALFGGTWTRRH
jgi:hypothetical protein